MDFKHDDENTVMDRSRVPRYALIVDFMVSAAFFVAMIMYGVAIALQVINNNSLTLLQFTLIVGAFFIASFEESSMHQDWDAYANRFVFRPQIRKRIVKRITNSKPDSKQKHTK